jgi:hypothetical protein
VRVALVIALAGTGCSRLFGLDTPQLSTDAGSDDAGRGDAAIDAQPVDGAVDANPKEETLVFVQGSNGYSGAFDTYISQGSPTSSYPNDTGLRFRGTDRWALIEFDGILGGSGIPTGATIISATLTVYFQNPNPSLVNEVSIPWSSTVTYDTFGGSPGVQAGDVGALVDNAGSVTGAHDYDVTASISRWQAGTTNNYGWMFAADGGGGGDGIIRSCEDANNQRPKLTVTYLP